MAKLEIGTLKHAFRTEMSQVIHWSLILAVWSVVCLEVAQAWTKYAIMTKIFQV